MDVARRVWTPAERALFARIEAHAFEDAGIALDFTRRLAAHIGWPLATARAAVAEYRKYAFLAMVTTVGPVTPSEEVDEVWHLHLTYTRDYWERWCETLGRRLHHEPTAGGPAEAWRYRAQYAETLALYESYFGPPPAAFWPGTAQRFSALPRYRLVDGARMLVLRRPAVRRQVRVPLLAALLSAVPGSAAAAETDWTTTWNVLDWSGPPFLHLFIILLLASGAVAALTRVRARAARAPVDTRDLDTIEVAYLKGGRIRAADTLLLEMAVREKASLNKGGVEIGVGARELPRRFEPFRSLEPGRRSRDELMRIFAGSSAAAELQDALVRRNFLASEARAQASRWTAYAAMAPVLALGAVKIMVGLSRGRPVGYLVVLEFFTIVLVVLLFKGTTLTRAGAAALAELRTRWDRPIRAPRLAELPLAFAFLGSAALAGSPLADYATLIRSASASGCASSGCGGGGDGGGGGGGGCGGCGGGD